MIRQTLPVLLTTLFLLLSCSSKKADKVSWRQEGKCPIAEAKVDESWDKASSVDVGELRISGPYTHRNLSIYLVHGKDRLPGKRFLTLDQAMQAGKVTVHETGNVQKLSIENSSDDEVFVMSGDIVKGGKQDRVLSVDALLPPHSGKIDISSFCVESGRWSQRGRESRMRFASSGNRFSKKGLKMATKGGRRQEQVWDEVRRAQRDMSDNNEDYNPNEGASPSSMQLALENRSVKATARKFQKHFKKLLDSHDDLLGYAFAINGKINCADVYASKRLFLTLWEKLLKSTAIEAVSELHRVRAEDRPPGAIEVRDFFRQAEAGKVTHRITTGRTELRTIETPDTFLFESRDLRGEGTWIYRNYFTKDKKPARRAQRPRPGRRQGGRSR